MKTTLLRTLLLALTFTLFTAQVYAQVTVAGSTGADGTYTMLNLAFTAINGTAQTGNNIVVTITASTTEAAAATLNAGTWTSLNIYPTVTGLSVSGNLAAPLIDLNGADNVTIDGRVNQAGVKDLTITNTSTSATAGTSTIRFINDATANTMKYCTVKGSEMDASGGVIFFSTAGTGNGNDGNTIDNNNITNSSDANRPLNAVYSAGTTAKTNSGNTISNNNIYDFLNRGTASNGIQLSSYNTTWTIMGNSLYETASFAPAASIAYTPINVSAVTAADIIVSGNYIGGSAALCAGSSAWTKTATANNTFSAISISVGPTVSVTSSIQGNTIKNFVWSDSGASSWSGIVASGTGNVNVGTVTGNTIGAPTTGGITITAAAAAANVYGVYISGTGTVDCQNNVIQSIIGANTALNNTNIYGVYRSAVAGTTTISNNTIGSTTVANSINATSISTNQAQNVYGISNAGTGAITINGNTIANLTNGSTCPWVGALGAVNGIYASDGTSVIVTNNIIHDLTIANASTNTGFNATVGGIVLKVPNSVSITGNTIYNLSNTNSSYAGDVNGIFLWGGGVCSGNFIHSLSVTGASSTAASIYGIRAESGITTYSNNIVNLGGNTKTTLYGMYDACAINQTCNIYNNTVYLGGTLAAGSTNKSYCMYSAAVSSTKNYRNNLFANARSTTGGASLHYAISIATNISLTCNYNNYWVTGTGGVLGSMAAVDKGTLALWQGATGQDAQSLYHDPSFTNAGSTVATDYTPAYNKLIGISGTGVTTDYTGATRAATPTMGALEGLLSLYVDVYISNVFQKSYICLKDAFAAINAGTHTGVLDVRINTSTTEPASAVLNASGSGSASYTGINVYPTKTGLSVTGNLATPLIDLNGADNVTIDGSVNGAEAAKDLTITNTSTSAVAGTSTIRFINDATANTLKYCTIKGSTLDAAGGMIFFSTTTGTTGNDNNTIDTNNITNSADANRPLCAVWSVGIAANENSGNTISNNAIYDFLNRGVASQGIYFGANTTACAVTANSLYETTTFVPTAAVAYYPIYINNTAGTGFTVTSNYIGGQAVACGSSAWTKTNAFSNAFNGIYMNVGTTPISNAQNNTIKNFAWSNAAATPWFGIYVAGGKVDTSGLSVNRGL